MSKKINKNVYLVFRTFTTGNRHNDALFGIAYSVFDNHGCCYASDLLMRSLDPRPIAPSSSSSSSHPPPSIVEENLSDEDLDFEQDDSPRRFVSTEQEWSILWRKCNWSLDYFDVVWKEHLKLLSSLQSSSNINCEDTPDVLRRFYTDAVSVAFKHAKSPMFVDINNNWNLLLMNILLVQDNDKHLLQLQQVNVIEFKSFVLGILRAPIGAKSLSHYEQYCKTVIMPSVKIRSDCLDEMVNEIFVYAQHTLYLDAYLNQNDISKFIQPSRTFMLGLIVLGFFCGILSSVFF